MLEKAERKVDGFSRRRVRTLAAFRRQSGALNERQVRVRLGHVSSNETMFQLVYTPSRGCQGVP
jgi:hypothetical protein